MNHWKPISEKQWSPAIKNDKNQQKSRDGNDFDGCSL